MDKIKNPIIEVIGNIVGMDGVRRITFLMHLDNIDKSIGMCLVDLHKNGEAEIYDMQINEGYRGKGYGSKLWDFAEKYVIEKYHPKPFVGELNIGANPKVVEFWKSLNFEIRVEDSTLAYATKSVQESTKKPDSL